MCRAEIDMGCLVEMSDAIQSSAWPIAKCISSPALSEAAIKR
jgi:hypothetical protein